MLKIKTILAEVHEFDELVNAAIAEGWELVKRDILPPFEGPTRLWTRACYAELEREEEEPEEDDEMQDELFTEWRLTRDPAKPYMCTACTYRPDPSKKLPRSCPKCDKIIFERGGVQ